MIGRTHEGAVTLEGIDCPRGFAKSQSAIERSLCVAL
jgi:hypothetical protein